MSWLNFSSRYTLPMIMQAQHDECSVACMAMVLCSFGHRTSIQELRQQGEQSCGTSLKSVLQLAVSKHLSARPVRLEMSELRQLSLPAILHWDLNHFVVLKKASRRKFTIHDPAIGIRQLSEEAMGQHFTGVAIEVLPGKGFVQCKPPKRLKLRDLWTRTQGLIPALGQVFVLSLLLQCFALGLPFYTQLFIDDVLVNQDYALLKVLAAGFLMITITKSITELVRAYAIMALSNRVSFQFAANVFRHLLHLPLNFFSSRHMGDIVSRFGSLNKIRDFLCSGIVEVIIDGMMVMGTLVLMFVYSAELTWVALIAVIVYGALRFSVHRHYQACNEEVIYAGAQENTSFMETVRAIQGIKLFGREVNRLCAWQHNYADVINSGVRLQKLGIHIKFFSGLLVGIENIVLMLLGGYAVLNNQISMGMIIAYISFKDQFYNRVFALIDKSFEFKLLDLHLERLADIALNPKEEHFSGFGMPAADVCLEGGLTATDLSFRYSDDRPYLFRSLNLTVEKSESVAIIGPTGCGKSTLLRIMLSLLLPSSGSVNLHGVPVQGIGLQSFRQNVAGVLQDDTLLSGTIFDNITFFDPQPDRERVEYVAHLAAIAKDIRAMPMQYNTLVGSMGASLSGGQVQRILLARALYKRPRVLVLDEASSHLDVETEALVNKAIQQMDIARLMVAHRPQTIVQADRILRLNENGLESVKHSEVLINNTARAETELLCL